MGVTSFRDMLSDRRWHDAAYRGLMLAACAVFLAMNVLTPFKEDDMLHSLVIGELTHVESFGDLLRSWWNKLFVLNGRSSDMIAELFCAMLGKPVFNVLNAVVFGLFSHAVSLLSTGRRSLLSLSLLYCCVAVCYPYPGETLLWLAGSVNYLWTITASLWLLLYLERHDGSRPLGWAKGLLLFLASFVAGSGNEATSFGFLGAWCMYYLLNRDRFDRRVLVVLAGYALGVLLIMASPAAWNRAASGGIVTDLPLLELLRGRVHVVAERMLRFVTPMTALGVGVGCLLWKGFKPLKSSVWTYLFVGITLVMLALGLLLDRPYAPLVAVSLIITILGIDTLLRRYWPLRAMLALAALVWTACCCAGDMQVMQRYRQLEREALAGINEAPRQAVLQRRAFNGGESRFVYPLRFDGLRLFSNEYIWRAYYDKENLQFVSDSVHARYHEGRLLDGATEMPFKCDRPGLLNAVQAFPDQDYMVMLLNVDTIPCTTQVGMLYWDEEKAALSPEQRARRQELGGMGNMANVGFYPLRYSGRVMFVLPLLDDCDTCLSLSLDHRGQEMFRLIRTAPNPAEIKPMTDKLK